MFRKTMLAVTAIGLFAGSAAMAAPCKDAHGKFVKCPTAVAAPGTTKDAKGRCHVASGPKKGQLTKC